MAQPSDISNLFSWYKADSLALTNGTAVSTWTDSSGNDLCCPVIARL